MLKLEASRFYQLGVQDLAERPLFPCHNGSPLSHKATLAAVRAAAITAGEAPTRKVGPLELERFGEHCMRVSGAQHITLSLRWELFVVQLFGRWGSMAVARYVQDTPLAAAASKGP